MSGMCKSDQRQNSKNRNKWQAKENARTWEVRKGKRIATDKRRKDAAARKIERRTKRGKPMRGHARAMRRQSFRQAA
jgi:hypothetical protein